MYSVKLAFNQAGDLGSLGGGGGEFLRNGMTLAGNVGNWMILFGGGNLSPVTGSLSHPIPIFTLTTCLLSWKTKKNVNMTVFFTHKGMRGGEGELGYYGAFFFLLV